MWSRIAPAGKRVALAGVLLLACFLLGTHATAQGLKGGAKGPGSWINNPTEFARIRAEAALEFRNESLSETRKRVLAGMPRFVPAALATRVRARTETPIWMLLRESDGASRVAIRLPNRFAHGLLVVGSESGAFAVPLFSSTLGLDVRRILEVADAAELDRVRLQFLGFHQGRIQSIVYELAIDRTQRTVTIEF